MINPETIEKQKRIMARVISDSNQTRGRNVTVRPQDFTIEDVTDISFVLKCPDWKGYVSTDIESVFRMQRQLMDENMEIPYIGSTEGVGYVLGMKK